MGGTATKLGFRGKAGLAALPAWHLEARLWPWRLEQPLPGPSWPQREMVCKPNVRLALFPSSDRRKLSSFAAIHTL